MDKKRILIADDHPLIRHGVRASLEATTDLTGCGEATNGDESVDQADALVPDLILMDIQMPGLNGIKATRRILSTYPGRYILILTMIEDDLSVFIAMRAGARGYVLKDAQKEDLLRAIRAVASGEAIFSPTIAKRVIAFSSKSHPIAPAQAFPELTERESEVPELIAQGLSNAEIATRLVLSASTVCNYITSIFSKLQVADLAQAIVKARYAGLS